MFENIKSRKSITSITSIILLAISLVLAFLLFTGNGERNIAVELQRSQAGYGYGGETAAELSYYIYNWVQAKKAWTVGINYCFPARVEAGSIRLKPGSVIVDRARNCGTAMVGLAPDSEFAVTMHSKPSGVAGQVLKKIEFRTPGSPGYGYGN